MNGTKYTASRLADGNKLFPPEITILDDGIQVKIPGFFSGQDTYLYYNQISFVDAKTPLIGYSTLTIGTDAGFVTVHGFSKSDVEAIKNAIKAGKAAGFAPSQMPAYGSIVEIDEGTTDIDEDTLSDYKHIDKLVLPSSLTSIDADTFCDHHEIQEIDFTKVDRLREIPDDLFSDLDIHSLVIPEGVEVMGDGAISDCSNLTSITLPSCLTKIKGSLVSSCKNLEHIDMSKVMHLTRFNDPLIDDDNNVKQLIIPQGVTQVKDLIDDCDCVLQTLFLPPSIEQVGAINGNGEHKINVYLFAHNATLNSGGWLSSGFYDDVRTLYVQECDLQHYTNLVKSEGHDVKVCAIPAEKMQVYASTQAPSAPFMRGTATSPPMAPPAPPTVPPQTFAGAQCPPTAPPDAAPAQRVQKRPGQLFSDELEELINMAVATGNVTDNMQRVIINRAINEGEDPDVVDMVIKSRLFKLKNG